MSKTIVLASSNPGKIKEFRRLLPDGVEIVLASDMNLTLPPETGHTFRDNAVIKAEAAAIATGVVAVGDDSGLEVDALDGKPGVRSARYAGEGATDEENVAKLLAAMTGVAHPDRTARFRCVIAIAVPDGTTIAVEGEATGTIGFQPRGGQGFGYDPVFVVSGGRTFAELTAAEKDAISHRGAALRAALPELNRILALQESYTGKK